MTKKTTKDKIITVRVSSRILQRLHQVLNGQQVSEFARLAILRQVERLERRGA